MPVIKRVYRAFGRFGFHVPAHGNDYAVDFATVTAGNMLEIFFHLAEGDDEFRAFVQVSNWKSGSLPTPPDTVPDAALNLFADDDARNAIVEALKTDDTTAFWITRPLNGHAQGGHRLRVYGLVALDEFKGSGDRDFVRLPLLRTLAYNGLQSSSVLTFGTGGASDGMRIEIGIPTPQGMGLPETTLAFGAIFQTSRERPNNWENLDDRQRFAHLTRVSNLMKGVPPGMSTLEPYFSHWGRSLSDIGSHARSGHGTLLAEVAKFSGADAGHGDFLKSLKLQSSASSSGQKIEFLAGHRNHQPHFAISLSSTQTDGAPLPLLGAKGPDFQTKPLSIQTIATCSLTDDRLKKALTGAGDAALPWDLHLSLSATSKVQLKNGLLQPIAPETAPHSGGGLAQAAFHANSSRAGLVATLRQPQSALPLLKFGNRNEQGIPLVSYASPTRFSVSGTVGAAGHVNFAEGYDTQTTPIALTTTFDCDPEKYSHHAPDDMIWIAHGEAPGPIALTLFFPTLADRTGPTTPAHGFPAQLEHASEALKPDRDHSSIVFRFGNDDQADPATGESLSSRLGSMQLRGTRGVLLQPSGEGVTGQLRIRPAARPEPDGLPEAFPAPRLSLEWTFNFALDDARPVTTDVAHGDRDERPDDLLIHEATISSATEDAAIGKSKSPFTLEMVETLRDDQNRHLTASLYDTDSRSPGSNAVTVLNDRPFSIYRYHRQPLNELGDSASGEVAIFDSDENVWRYKKTSETYLMLRQAGAIGEDADKPHRLELHDAVSRDDTAPVMPAENGTMLRRALDMRMSPAEALWIRSSDLARNYYLPPHAGRILFRQRGDFGLGVSLVALRSEALYGLSLGILVADSMTQTPPPRVAEIDALVGTLPLPDTNDTSDRETRWRDLHRLLRKRPERLEVWQYTARADNPFTPARFERGTSFALRHTALLAPPIDDERVHPAPPGDGAELLPPRFRNHGLAGGVLWPFESANLVRAVAQTVVADGGTLDRVALSPLGISAEQNVTFNNGTIRIISETRDGRLHKQRVEVMGRIAALWHRAKHVIIYERTTAPSPQFAPNDMGTRSTRAVLRKVSEFIEILEPVRRYPDMVVAPTSSCGFLSEVRFNAKIINVDSAWGKDHGDFGWEVPLWNRGTAERRPQVYPYPDIAFVTRAEGANEKTETAQDCRDAHLLYFFADAEAIAQGNADTDSWKVREGIDCSIMATRAVQETLLTSAKVTGGETDVRQPAASRLMPGMRRFTWRLSPSQSRTRINAAFAEKPIFAGLESVTFSRSAGLPPNADVGPQLAAIAESITQLGHRPKLKEGVVLPDFLTAAPAATGLPSKRFLDLFDQHKVLLTSGHHGDAAKKDEIRTALTDLQAARPTKADVQVIARRVLGADAGAALDAAAARLADNRLVEKLGALDGKSCDDFKTNATATIKRRKLVILQTLREVESAVLADLDAVTFIDKATLKTRLMDRIRDRTGDLVEGIDQVVGDVADGVATARASVADWRADALAALARAGARVDQAASHYDSTKPWSATRLRNALDQIDQEFGSAEAELDAALDEARQRMATEIGSAARSVSGLVATAINSVVRARQTGTEGTKGIESAYKRQAAAIKSAIGRIPDLTPEQLADLQAKAVKAGGTVETTWNKVRPLLDTDLPGLKQSAQQSVDNISISADATLDQIGDTVDRKATAVMGELTTIATQIGEVQQKLNELTDEMLETLAPVMSAMTERLDVVRSSVENRLKGWADAAHVFDNAVHSHAEQISLWIATVDEAARAGSSAVDMWFRQHQTAIKDAGDILGRVLSTSVHDLLETTVDAVVDPLPWPDPSKIEASRTLAQGAVRSLADAVEDRLDALSAEALSVSKAVEEEIKTLCQSLSGLKSELLKNGTDLLNAYAGTFEEQFDTLEKDLDGFLENAKQSIDDAKKFAESIESLIAGAADLQDAVNGMATEFAAAEEHAKAYLNGGLERAASVFEGKAEAVPGKVLELVSFLSHSPEIASLRTNADRARVFVDQARNALSTPKARAALDHLGDALKALGIRFDFEEIGDVLKPSLGDSFKLSSLIPNFGGINLEHLLPDTTRGKEFAEYIKITHDLDTKAGRAWVQVDIDAPLLDRQKMFSLGPFAVFITRSTLTAFQRAEASKTSSEVEITDRASLRTDLEATVGGQTVVTLKDVLITYTGQTGLDFDIDPRKIRIHKAMQFVQDTFGSLFGDDLGGLSLLYEGGQPVGVQHNFALPPMSLNFGTSGVSNIQLANHFALRAFPDFTLANRFNLSRRELPFIFSIFIIGGTGYLQVDTEYTPTDNSLSVVVEAGLGGSAALAFAFGPVTGGVSITLSIVLRYARRIGGPAREGDGLTVSVVLVIAGHVSLWGMVSIYLGLMLSMNYHESGRIDATGSLSVEVRISRWFKLKYSTSVTYQLRGGQSRTTRTAQIETSGPAVDAINNAKKLNQARKSL